MFISEEGPDWSRSHFDTVSSQGLATEFFSDEKKCLTTVPLPGVRIAWLTCRRQGFLLVKSRFKKSTNSCLLDVSGHGLGHK